MADPQKYASPHVCSAKLGGSRSNGNWDRDVADPLWSLKVIVTETDQSDTCDFLLTFRGNRGPISYHFRDKRQFQSNITKFFYPVYSTPLPKGFPLQLDIGNLDQKFRMMWLLGGEGSLTLSLTVWTQYTNVTDGQTERHGPTASNAQA